MGKGLYRLYGRRGSGSAIPQMILEEIGAPYECVWVGTEPADLAAYAGVAPTQKVPALQLPTGETMFESAAICMHLAAAHPEARLAPRAGSGEHALYLQWMVYLATSAYETVLRIYYTERYSEAGQAAAEGIRTRATQDFTRALALLAPSLDPFVLGSRLSAADFYLYVLAGWHPGGRAAVHALHPAFARHSAELAARASVRKVQAENAS